MKFAILCFNGALLLGSGCGQGNDLPVNGRALFAEDATAPTATTDTTARPTLGQRACKLMAEGPFVERLPIKFPYSDAMSAPTVSAEEVAYQLKIPEITDPMYEAGQRYGLLRFEVYFTVSYRVFLSEKDLNHVMFVSALNHSNLVPYEDTMADASLKPTCKLAEREYIISLMKGTYFLEWQTYIGNAYDRTLLVMLPVTDAVDALWE